MPSDKEELTEKTTVEKNSIHPCTLVPTNSRRVTFTGQRGLSENFANSSFAPLTFVMNPEIEKKLQDCPNLPSPPTIAVQIIKLANQTDIDFKQIIQLLNCDPALASKILRIANSPIYPYVKKVGNLHQALMVLGLNATISLALSFSLVQSLQTSKGTGLDYPLYWKRALMAATACQVLGNTCEITDTEELHLAALLQDLGMLALDQVFPDLYLTHSGQQSHHTSLIAHEQEILGLTHGEVGDWMLTQWNLPDRLRFAVAGSDAPSDISPEDERARFVYCVSLSGMVAEIFLRETDDEYLQFVTRQASALLQFTPETFFEVLESFKERLPETERIFETSLPTWDDPQAILETARESLLIRNLQALQQVEELRINTVNMEAKFSNLEESNRYDSLTGALTRAHLDISLGAAFEKAIEDQEPLTLLFCDLDKFKSINDTYGHLAGDMVLQSSVKLLQSKLRGTDVVGRYGGEEFVLILPKAQEQTSEMVCERILKAFRETTHSISTTEGITITISLGIATHTPENPYTSVDNLLGHADEAVYYSKTHGGNQATSYTNLQSSLPA